MKITYDEALDYLADELAEFFKNDPKKITYWLMTENLHLGGSCPAWVMLSHPDGPKKIWLFLRERDSL